MDLLLKDIMALKTMDTLVKRAKEMVRYVKGHQVIAAIYLTKHREEIKSITLKLPSNTRWGGVVIMFDSLLEWKKWPYHSLPIWTAPSRGSSWIMYFEREWEAA